MTYAVVYEKSSNGWGAYIPDLPGCVALGLSLAETKRLIRELADIHLRSLREDGDPIPAGSRLTDTPLRFDSLIQYSTPVFYRGIGFTGDAA